MPGSVKPGRVAVPIAYRSPPDHPPITGRSPADHRPITGRSRAAAGLRPGGRGCL